jgi:hypothetical protein
MAVAIVQQATAFASTGVGTLTVTLGTAPNPGNAFFLVVNGGAAISSVSGGLALLGQISSGNFILAVYRLYSLGPTSATVNFSGSTACAAWYAECSGVASSYFTSAAFGTTTPSITVNTPTTELQVAGDIPLALWSGLQPMTATAQAGWTELTQLNNTVNAVLEIQQGPAATGSNQAYTTQVTWSVTNPQSFGATVTLSGSNTNAVMSQEVVEALGFDTANAHLSQEYAEALGYDTSTAHLSQEPVEVLASDTALARLSQWYIEILVPLRVRLSQEVCEVLGRDTANVRVSQTYIEVIWSSVGERRRVVDDEMFTY